MKIGKTAIKYTALLMGVTSMIFFVLYFLDLQSTIEAMDPVVQFILFNLGIYLVFYIGFKAVTPHKDAFKGAVAAIFVEIAVDIGVPEYHVLKDGTLIKGGILGAGASDYVAGYLWRGIGATGLLVPILTYFVTPIILIALGVYYGYRFKSS